MDNKRINTTRGALTIRQAHEGDVQVFRELRLEALRAHPEAFGVEPQVIYHDGVLYDELLLALTLND